MAWRGYCEWRPRGHGGNTSLIDVMARDLRAEFGLSDYTSFIRASGVPEVPVQVKFEISQCMTAYKARKLYAALKSLGLEKWITPSTMTSRKNSALND